MSISTERAQELLAQYASLKETILKIDDKYSLHYREIVLDMPPLDLPRLTFTEKTTAELMQLATTEVSAWHQSKVMQFEQSYLRTKQTLQSKQLQLAESLRQKLLQLLKNYQQQIADIRRRLINNGIIFSSVTDKLSDEALTEYNANVTEANMQNQAQTDVVEGELTALEERYSQGNTDLQTQLQDKIQQAYNDLVYAQQKEQERVQKYNTTLEEKEVKYQTSCERAWEYARQAEAERAINAARLYAELGESGAQSQKMSEKYHYCIQYFMTWKKSEALLVIESDSFLNSHLGTYYQSFIDWIDTNLTN